MAENSTAWGRRIRMHPLSFSHLNSLSVVSVGRIFPRASTMPKGTKYAEKSETSSEEPNLERSKTEKHGQNSPHDDPRAQLFDDKIPDKQKMKMLNQIATVKDDGTVVVDVPSNFETTSINLRFENTYGEAVDEEPVDLTDLQCRPHMQIVILIVGTRGDVQPFVAIGKRLQGYGHRVRLATHVNFREFVLIAGLEFYPLGGDPKVLAEYMVKNKGFLPSSPSEIRTQRKQIKEIMFSLLPACEDADIDTGVPFKADAIIANPPAYDQPVNFHILFPLSYLIVDCLIWLGIWGMINDLRRRKLKLRPLSFLSVLTSTSNIPYGYIWSPHLIPKPKDWGPKIDVVGFCFLDLASNYEPPESLVDWLNAGEKPFYIGFGSLPVQEPEKMTEIIVEALKITGQRGIINKGWGGLGNLAEPKDYVYLLDNVPHDWLFLQCKAVVKENAVQLAKAMETEDGVSGAVTAFLKHLPPKISPQVTPEPSSFMDFLVAPVRRKQNRKQTIRKPRPWSFR
ncbi:sterol 3-beta-glucosyltransferase [Musa troglodytarum]|uniref:Sterol 3-beta-glucosyltransferase n=1 Tax=Musa troglodytarum TaxID=320322 RepID=A0A9E7G0G4_9LILI|nr:sterol 3-beta-glucosyltransferase [Musa troglodytarum]